MKNQKKGNKSEGGGDNNSMTATFMVIFYKQERHFIENILQKSPNKHNICYRVIEKLKL